MGRSSTITVSAPGKIHLLGEHAVVYGKPALLAAINLRVYITISKPGSKTVIPAKAGIQLTQQSEDNSPHLLKTMRRVIEPIIKKELQIKTLPPYHLTFSSQFPIGSGLGSSAAISACYIAGLLSLLKVKWDLNLIYELTFEAEKVFHGNPSGADPATVIYGGLIWFRKEFPDLKIIQPLPFSIPSRLARNFILIHTGKPKETTKDMVVKVKKLYAKKPSLVKKFLDNQEILVRQLLPVIKEVNEKELIRIIRDGEKNLESIEVCSPSVKKIIREIEKIGGAAKICGAGATAGPTGVVLAFHPNKIKLIKVIKSLNLPYFIVRLGVQGLRKE